MRTLSILVNEKKKGYFSKSGFGIKAKTQVFVKREIHILNFRSSHASKISDVFFVDDVPVFFVMT